MFRTGAAGTRESGTAGQNTEYRGRLALGWVNRQHEDNLYFVGVRVDSDCLVFPILGQSEDAQHRCRAWRCPHAWLGSLAGRHRCGILWDTVEMLRECYRNAGGKLMGSFRVAGELLCDTAEM